MENDYKRYQFPDILHDGVQQENHNLRQQLGSLQEKFTSHELIHNLVRDQLEDRQKQNLTLKKALETAYELVDLLKNPPWRKNTATGQEEQDYKLEFGDSAAKQGYVDSIPEAAEMGTINIQNEKYPQQSSGKRLLTMF